MTSVEGISYAFRKLDDFAVVQTSKSKEEQSDAFGFLLSSFGLEPELKEAVYEQIMKYAEGAYYDPRTLGFMLLGVAAGLAIAEHERDNSA